MDTKMFSLAKIYSLIGFGKIRKFQDPIAVNDANLKSKVTDILLTMPHMFCKTLPVAMPICSDIKDEFIQPLYVRQRVL